MLLFALQSALATPVRIDVQGGDARLLIADRTYYAGTTFEIERGTHLVRLEGPSPWTFPLVVGAEPVHLCLLPTTQALCEIREPRTSARLSIEVRPADATIEVEQVYARGLWVREVRLGHHPVQITWRDHAMSMMIDVQENVTLCYDAEKRQPCTP
ncbi:MAG: hypothetical protein H6736_14950 [Alphaproteobacteria bacterium]|nr:hypothetical protein [Alphaproteobacteria bacterium]MCB9693106.1 hypothetical protein [Alphaproteobacteria bacterium]